MNSLRARIVALCALIALISSAVCAIAASRAAVSGLERSEDAMAAAAVDLFKQNLAQSADTLAHELSWYAQRDDLHAQMPDLQASWAKTLFRRDLHPNGSLQVLAFVNKGAVVGRYFADDGEPSTGGARDAAEASALVRLAAPGMAKAGLGSLNGHPALFAVSAVRRADGSGDSRGQVIGLAYLDDTLLSRLSLKNWRAEVRQSAFTSAAAALSTNVQRDDQKLAISFSMLAVDGIVAATLDRARQSSLNAQLDSQKAIFFAGLATAIAALIVGPYLGWSWLRPIMVLADACRLRALDPQQPLPRVSGLAEAEVLADGLQVLVAAQRASEEKLAQTLERETIANAVHERFLAQLGQEFGQPIRLLIAAIDRLQSQNGRLEPDQVMTARQAALQLEERFQEVLGLTADQTDAESGISRQNVNSYLAGVIALIKPIAERRKLGLTMSASENQLPINARLLTPILVNLAANAIKATESGAVHLSVQVGNGHSAWRVSDTGSGIAPDLAKRIEAACQRGEVLPGEPGLGLGLALALANTRALGGTLRLVENGAGGATFELKVPMVVESSSWRRKTEARS